jgi:bifunctional non-homologous end joining protein LigD
MGLATYRRKRHFDRTPEPRGGRRGARGPLRFVVQKHAATRLHYDFRLEADGALKSWAVPKGPSLDPRDKRLAVLVEDHPLEYRTFEGTIPAGNYGAGTVIVWDRGSYAAAGATGRKDSERLMREGLARGRLSLVLDGEKLKGEFALVRLPKGKGNEWLLMKKRDRWASEADVTAQDRSVVTGRDLREVGNGAPARGRPRKPPSSSVNGRAAPPGKPVPRSASAARVRPMLATLVDAPFDRRGWLFEVKWDGYRAIADVGRRGVRLYSRTGKPFDGFAPVVESLRRLGHDAILDGEVVALDDAGRSAFQLLQSYRKTGKGRLAYYVFDLLRLDGRDLRELPLRHRKKLLAGMLRPLPAVRLSEHVEREGVAFFRAAVEQGLEGVVAKDGAGPYEEGVRSRSWLKIKTRNRQEAVIAGFTEPRGSRTDLGALLLGLYDGDEFTYIGHTGGGLDAAARAALRARLGPLVRKTCPFPRAPRANAPVHWVEPRLVCEVEFQQWTDDGVMRQPVFVGLREDKPPRAVKREEGRPVRAVVAAAEPARTPTRRAGRRIGDRHPPAGDPPLTNLDKVFWPREGFTKGDLVAYYREVAPVLLPYLRDRPQSLHRHPNGITGKSFFQKDVGGMAPDWVETAPVESRGGETISYLVCQDEETLLYLANLGCIELNPWLSRTEALDRPDFLVIDLDPAAVPTARVVEAAQELRRLFDGAGVPSYCKSSGKDGLHVCVPLGARYDYAQARRFAELVARLVHGLLPRTTSVVRSPAQRQGRVYLDYLQNRPGQTLAAPYCVRPVPGARVSAPLRWSEVKKGLDPSRYTMRTLPRRLERVGDLWAPVCGPGIDLASALDALESKASNGRAGGSRAG